MSKFEIEVSEKFIQDLEYLAKEDKKLVDKVYKILESIQETPFSGIGKPEGLKHNLSGYWSRRISRKHRLIYSTPLEGKIQLVSCYEHY